MTFVNENSKRIHSGRCIIDYSHLTTVTLKLSVIINELHKDTQKQEMSLKQTRQDQMKGNILNDLIRFHSSDISFFNYITASPVIKHPVVLAVANTKRDNITLKKKNRDLVMSNAVQTWKPIFSEQLDQALRNFVYFLLYF